MIDAGTGGGIGGSPGAVEGAAAAITTAATTMTTTGQGIADHGDAVVARWSGTTSDAAHQRIRHLSERTDVGAEVVSGLPKILTDYAAELRGAQADHAAGVAAAVVARASLTQATTAMTGASAMDDGPERATAMRLSGQAQAYATEAVAASSHTIDAAIAREHVANEAAATAVHTLTALLDGFTPSDPGQSPTSVRAVEAADGYTDTGGGRDLAWIERTAQHVVNAAGGALDTAYIVPQGPGYLILRRLGYTHEEAMAKLERDHQAMRDVLGADTDSPEYQFFDLHDNIEAANAGTDGGGVREVVGAGGEVAWGIAPGVVSAYGHASPDPGMNALASSLDTVHDRLEDEWGADTDTRLYQRSVLVGQIATVFGGPGAAKGVGVLARAGREGEEAAAAAAARDSITQVNRDAAHGDALADDAARTAAASQAAAARATSLEQAAAQQMAAKMNRPLEHYRTTPTIQGSPGHTAPADGRTTPMGPVADSQTIIDPIGSGHSYPKHVDVQQEFPGVTDRETLKVVVADVVAHGTAKEIRPGVFAYWKEGVIVINDPKNPDLGTVFVPDKGYDYFYKLDDLST